MRRPAPSSDETGSVRPENWVAGVMVSDGGAEQRGDLGPGEGRDQQARYPVVATTYSNAAGDSASRLPLSGTPNSEDRQRQEHDEAHHSDGHVGQLLAEQELERGSPA